MLQKFYNKYLSSEFFRNVFTLSSGSIIAQFIPILIMPVLTRLFTVETFGIYFIYSSIFAVLVIISTFRIELAILIPKSDKEAINLLAISLIFVFLFSLISLLIIVIFKNNIIAFLDNEKIGYWLYFIPLSVFLIGSFQSFTYWSNRFKKYKLITIGRINKSSISGASQIATGLTKLKTIGLIPGLIIGQFTSLISIIFRSYKTFEKLMSSISFKSMIMVLKRFKDIPVFNTLIGLINTLSIQLPFFFMPRFFGTSTVGYYGLSYRIISAPVTHIGYSIGQVSFQRSSEILNKGKELLPLVKKNYLNAFKLAFIPYLILFLFAPFLFRIFGSEWVIAGEYTQILIPFLFLNFLNSTNSFVVTLLNKQKVVIIYDILLLICRFLSIYLGYVLFGDAKMAIILFSATGVLFHCLFFLIIISFARKSKLDKVY